MHVVLAASKFIVASLHKLEWKIDQNQTTISHHLQSQGAQVELDTKSLSPLPKFHFGDSDPEDNHAKAAGDDPAFGAPPA